ncbi:hypothetical protein [Trichloromonas sp.]|uniref:hypothetical protein n=1 Tax=Trichloromonas sp. TaxID=3069249 RepID=UPI002A49896C|nr:hypothetical protein [Trichloromonas sp.]
MSTSLRLPLLLCFLALIALPFPTLAGETVPIEEFNALKARVAELEALLLRGQGVMPTPAPQAAAAPVTAEQKAEAPSESETLAVAVTEKEGETTDHLKVGGALRFNYTYNDDDRWHEDGKEKGGDFKFDLFRLDVNGSYSDVKLSAQYRFMEDRHFIHHGWLGYNFSDETGVQLGLTQVPFGLLPYASHNFWFGLPYYLGFEDDYDLGLKAIHQNGPWDLQLAFFKNADFGNASDLDRYSYDIVKENDQNNEESNQFNARLAYRLDHGDLGDTELGVSGQWGQLYNGDTGRNGDHWAAAAHVNGTYGPFNLMLEVIEYEHNPKNPAGVDDKVVRMGAFGWGHDVAAKGTVYVAGLSYDVPVSWGPVSKLTFYNDYSRLVKAEEDFEDSEINTLGCLVTAGPVYTYIDFIMGKNATWIGSIGEDGFGAGRHRDEGWNTKFNINVGYYF